MAYLIKGEVCSVLIRKDQEFLGIISLLTKKT